LLLLRSNRLVFSCAVSFESKKKKIPDLSLPPCNAGVHMQGPSYYDAGYALSLVIHRVQSENIVWKP
jgi:hypothetical protein